MVHLNSPGFAQSGFITTYVGPGMPIIGALADSQAIDWPASTAPDGAGGFYVNSVSQNRVYRVTAEGRLTLVAGKGTGGFSGDGGPARAAQLSYPADIAVDKAGNLFIADTYNSRIHKVIVEGSATTFFPQVAVGGGYSTLFTVTNTGSTSASGSLVLTDQQGNPLPANITLTHSLGNTQPALPFGNALPFAVPAGGTTLLVATGVAGSPVKDGWARLESAGGSLTAMATYEYVVDGSMQTIVGVLQSQPLQFATIAVDNDNRQSKQTACAIANPGSRSIDIKLALVGQDGRVVDDTVTVTLGPGQQIAKYLWQDLALTDFKGSLVLRGQSGATFIAVALVEKQGLLTAIPVIPGKAPGVPNY